MKLGQLYQYISSLVEEANVDLDTPVICIGEYGYGTNINAININEKMSHIDDKTFLKENVPVVYLTVNSYLFESEDVGYSNMWIPNEMYESTKEYFNESQKD